MPIIKLFNRYVKDYNVSENFADGRPFVDNVKFTPSRDEAKHISHDMVSRVLAVVRKMASESDANDENTLIHVTSSRDTFTRKAKRDYIYVDGEKIKLYFFKRGFNLKEIGLEMGMSDSNAHNIGRYFAANRLPTDGFNKLRKKYPSISYYVVDKGSLISKADVKTDTHTCVLCHKEFSGYGNNPFPASNSGGRCCDDCNDNVVIPLRIKMLNDKHK